MSNSMHSFCNLYRENDELPVFGVTGNVGFVSVLDQMNRGQLLGRSLTDWLDSFFPVDHRLNPILVVGAGACGASAAIELASQQDRRPVHLIEKSEFPFSRQFKCNTRWIDPSLYEWPSQAWSQLEFPSEKTHKSIFKWTGGFSKGVAIKWLSDFQDWQMRLGDRFVFYKNTYMSEDVLSLAGGALSVPLVTRQDGDLTTSLETYDCIIVACLLYTSPSPRDRTRSRMPSSA